jgi:hypothetical protein
VSPERILALLLALVLLANATQVFMSRRLKHIKRVADEVKAESGRIHVLVNSRLSLTLKQNSELLAQNAELIQRLADTEGAGK